MRLNTRLCSASNWTEIAGLYRDNERFPLSYVHALPPEFMHQRCALLIRTRQVRHGVYHFAGFHQNIRSGVGDFLGFLPAAGQIPQKHRHVIIGIGPRVAARPRAEQHPARNALAVQGVERGAEFLEDGGVGDGRGMIEGGGWEVIDLGVDAGTDKFLKAINEHPGAVIGLSALLTTTMENMKNTVSAIREKHADLKILVGGAPVTTDYCKKIGADFYSPDPQGAVNYLKQLVS